MAHERLILLRHAQAGDAAGFAGADRDRPLTAGGEASAQAIARALAGCLSPPTLLVSSPYLRARQTAGPLAEALGVPLREKKWLAPGQLAGLELEALAGRLPADGRLVIVGHEPDLSTLAGRLLGLTSGASPVRLGKGDALGLEGALPGQMRLVWHLPRTLLERLADCPERAQ